LRHLRPTDAALISQIRIENLLILRKSVGTPASDRPIRTGEDAAGRRYATHAATNPIVRDRFPPGSTPMHPPPLAVSRTADRVMEKFVPVTRSVLLAHSCPKALRANALRDAHAIISWRLRTPCSTWPAARPHFALDSACKRMPYIPCPPTMTHLMGGPLRANPSAMNFVRGTGAAPGNAQSYPEYPRWLRLLGPNPSRPCVRLVRNSEGPHSAPRNPLIDAKHAGDCGRKRGPDSLCFYNASRPFPAWKHLNSSCSPK